MKVRKVTSTQMLMRCGGGGKGGGSAHSGEGRSWGGANLPCWTEAGAGKELCNMAAFKQLGNE